MQKKRAYSTLCISRYHLEASIIAAAVPTAIHAVLILQAPVFINHRIAVQWGALTVSGDIASPVNVNGVHHLTYACDAPKCNRVQPTTTLEKTTPLRIDSFVM